MRIEKRMESEIFKLNDSVQTVSVNVKTSRSNEKQKIKNCLQKRKMMTVIVARQSATADKEAVLKRAKSLAHFLN